MSKPSSDRVAARFLSAARKEHLNPSGALSEAREILSKDFPDELAMMAHRVREEKEEVDGNGAMPEELRTMDSLYRAMNKAADAAEEASKLLTELGF